MDGAWFGRGSLSVVFVLLVLLVTVDWMFHGGRLKVIFSIKRVAYSGVLRIDFMMVEEGNGDDFDVGIVEEDVEGIYVGRKKGRRREGD